MDCTAWRFWTMRQSNDCSTPAQRWSTAKQWLEQLAQKKKKIHTQCVWKNKCVNISKHSTASWDVFLVSNSVLLCLPQCSCINCVWGLHSNNLSNTNFAGNIFRSFYIPRPSILQLCEGILILLQHFRCFKLLLWKNFFANMKTIFSAEVCLTLKQKAADKSSLIQHRSPGGGALCEQEMHERSWRVFGETECLSRCVLVSTKQTWWRKAWLKTFVAILNLRMGVLNNGRLPKFFQWE